MAAISEEFVDDDNERWVRGLSHAYGMLYMGANRAVAEAQANDDDDVKTLDWLWEKVEDLMLDKVRIAQANGVETPFDQLVKWIEASCKEYGLYEEEYKEETSGLDEAWREDLKEVTTLMSDAPITGERRRKRSSRAFAIYQSLLDRHGVGKEAHPYIGALSQIELDERVHRKLVQMRIALVVMYTFALSLDSWMTGFATLTAYGDWLARGFGDIAMRQLREKLGSVMGTISGTFVTMLARLTTQQITGLGIDSLRATVNAVFGEYATLAYAIFGFIGAAAAYRIMRATMRALMPQQRVRRIIGSSASSGEMTTGQLCATCYSPASKRCSDCKVVAYCSSECQSQDWERSHSVMCDVVMQYSLT